MRRSLVPFLLGFLTFALLSASFGAPSQDPEPQSQDGEADYEDDSGLTPFTQYRERERLRLAKEVEGAWTLTYYDNPARVVDQANILGFATFQDGFMTLVLQAQRLEQGILGTLGVQAYIQTGVYRYRFSELADLQTATVLGYSNANDLGQLQFEQGGEPREYAIQLTDNELTLRRLDGTEFLFSRSRSGDFPQDAIDELNALRSGIPAFEDPYRR